MAARRRAASLGTLEGRVMKVVWRQGRATVHDVRGAMKGGRKLAYTTILTTLRNLENKGLLRHEVEGRRHVYLPVVTERAAARSALRSLLDGLFDGSRVRLVDALFESENLSRSEFEQLRKQVLEFRRKEEDDA
jgi:predicted transcriptional regulator